MQCHKAYTTAVMEKLSWLAPSSRTIAEIYGRVLMYNRTKPFHKDTCLRYSTQERRDFQRKNLKTLEELAKLRKVDSSIKFHIFERVRISMTINGSVYNPRNS